MVYSMGTYKVVSMTNMDIMKKKEVKDGRSYILSSETSPEDTFVVEKIHIHQCNGTMNLKLDNQVVNIDKVLNVNESRIILLVGSTKYVFEKVC